MKEKQRQDSAHRGDGPQWQREALVWELALPWLVSHRSEEEHSKKQFLSYPKNHQERLMHWLPEYTSQSHKVPLQTHEGTMIVKMS